MSSRRGATLGVLRSGAAEEPAEGPGACVAATDDRALGEGADGRLSQTAPVTRAAAPIKPIERIHFTRRFGEDPVDILTPSGGAAVLGCSSACTSPSYLFSEGIVSNATV